MITRFQSIIIGSPEITGSDAFIPLEETPSLNSEGWDDLVISYATKRASLTAEELADEFPPGTQLGSRKFWVTSATRKCPAHGIWIAEVHFKGWAADKPAKFSVGAAAENQSNNRPTEIFGVGVFEKVSIHQNTPTLRASYLVEDYTTAPTAEVGTARTPPLAIDTPPEAWTSLAEFVYHWPNGWVLMSSEPDLLPGCTAALVTDTYKFIRAYTP
jgi:hypothetical protein